MNPPYIAETSKSPAQDVTDLQASVLAWFVPLGRVAGGPHQQGLQKMTNPENELLMETDEVGKWGSMGPSTQQRNGQLFVFVPSETQTEARKSRGFPSVAVFDTMEAEAAAPDNTTKRNITDTVKTNWFYTIPSLCGTLLFAPAAIGGPNFSKRVSHSAVLSKEKECDAL